MSLINRVLKDLERRQAPSMSAELALPPEVHATQPPRRRMSPRLVLAGLLLVIVVGLAWRYAHRPPVAEVRHETPPVAQPAAPAVTAMAPSAPPAPAPPSQNAVSSPQPAHPELPKREDAVRQPAPRTQPPVAAREHDGRATAEGESVRETGAGEARDAAAETDRPTPATAPVKPSRREAAATGSAERAGSIDKQVRAPSAADRAEAEFRAGMEAFQAGRQDEAEAAWTRALALDPASASARQALLAMLLDRGDRARAEQVLKEGLQVNPRQVKHAMLLARLQLERGNQTEALRTLEDGLPYAQWSADYLAMTARVMARTGRNSDAAELYRGALRLAPGNPVWEIGFGLALRADGRTSEAREAFERARESQALTPDLQAFVERQLKGMR